ncbi:hypothetical protein [Oceanobacillus timonensis]|uniref:hypothetical protein n=1 Tax=Oceanobacillus timonensis TaxID=1926285 RepID=UPI0009BAF14F|nr:hypothetical protein [Oceanobacillus timonensis]
MSLKAIKKYVDLCLIGQEAIPERKEIVREQQENVNKELEKLQRCAAYLRDKMDFYERLQQGEEAYDKSNPLEWNKKENSDYDF